ncbi:hypothetical protein RCL1_002333 [Eukaryota sp. TZLM3-RCL]
MCLRGRFGTARNQLFTSDLAEPTDETANKLQELYPHESFKCAEPPDLSYWTEHPFTYEEVSKHISTLPSGKAGGPSGIAFDLIKDAARHSFEVSEDLTFSFNQIMTIKMKLQKSLTASCLIAVQKAGGGVRPIAVGESIARILSSLIFNRISKKANIFLLPFQFEIKTIDGASSAALSSETFFLASSQNFIFNLDFKNAFNSVKRLVIHENLLVHFPEVLPYFYHFYGTSSDLVFNEKSLSSSSGVKQGDPLGPFLFCLAIHPILDKIQRSFPDVHIICYMDDISIIGDIQTLKSISEKVVGDYEGIGPFLNVKKCLLIVFVC